MAAGRRPGAIQFCAGGIFHCHLPTCTISRGRPWEDVRCDVGGHPTSMTDAWSCGTYVLLQQAFLVFSQRDELRWCRSVVRLAARPFAARFRAGLAACRSSALVQASCIRRNATAAGAVALDLFTNLNQRVPRTDGDLARRVVRPNGQVGVSQQNLQGQQGSFEFTMKELH